ncbi:TPA: hypothetical protein ACLGPE_002898 [Salmonella enterica]
MERDEEHATLIAGEIGGAVIQFIDSSEINHDNVVGYLEGKRKVVGNVIHKVVLRDSETIVQMGIL